MKQVKNVRCRRYVRFPVNLVARRDVGRPDVRQLLRIEDIAALLDIAQTVDG